jgi:4-amino-4-deoxy-L-arabinose transferase-like glycosyltransferase
MDEQSAKRRLTTPSLILLALILAAGIFLRIWPTAGFKLVGIDEHNYATYVEQTLKYGLTDYGHVIDDYITAQVKERDAVVPATRIGFIWPAAIVARITRLDSLYAVRTVSAASAILLLLATATIGLRFGGARQSLVVTALMAAAPLQIALAQRALGDEYFALWAVLSAWFFFECLQDRQARRWHIAFGFSFFMLVLTKENAAFVCAALLAVWIWFSLGRITRPNYVLLIVTFIAGAAAVLVLASLLGGIGEWLTFYRMYGQKSARIPYVIQFQDGAWYRYLIDFTLLSPLIVALTFGRVFKIDKNDAPDLFWALFLGFSFIAMSCVPFGFSLRFAAYWDVPLRWLAASQLVILADRFSSRWRNAVLITAVALVLLVDLAQYHRFFVKAEIYDPVSSHLLRASKLVK